MKEVEKEFADMRVDLRDLEHELEFQRRSGAVNSNDLFVPVMEDFGEEVRTVFSDLQTLIADTKAEVGVVFGHMIHHMITMWLSRDHNMVVT